MGRALTQSLFLECGYNTQHAIFTLNDEDKEYKGKTYISLKRLFLEAEDPIEYEFAKQHLLGWQHWQRLNRNKMLGPIFEEWREELELSIRSAAVKGLIDESVTGEKPFQAQKWLADKGWSKNGVGRPSKENKAHKEAMEDRIRSEFDEDFARMDKAGIDAKRTMVN
jgi:hypothetical protein